MTVIKVLMSLTWEADVANRHLLRATPTIIDSAQAIDCGLPASDDQRRDPMPLVEIVRTDTSLVIDHAQAERHLECDADGVSRTTQSPYCQRIPIRRADMAAR